MTPTLQSTYTVLLPKMGEPRFKRGVPWYELAADLGFATVPRLDAFLRNLEQRNVVALDGQDLDALRGIAASIAAAHRGWLRSLAEGIAKMPRGQRPAVQNVRELNAELRDVVSNLIEKRMADIRKVGRDCKRPGCLHETVTMGGLYRIVRPGNPSFDIAQNLLRVYWSIVRPAWYAPIGYIEKRPIAIAQENFRRALRTGILNDDDGVQRGQCMALPEIPDADVRAALERALALSDSFQKIVGLFYEAEYDYLIMRCSARAYAVDVVRLLTAIRNDIIRMMNDLFVPSGCQPLPLVSGCGRFPHHDEWIPPGSFDGEPVRLSDTELQCSFDTLYSVGLDLWFEARMRREPPPRPADPAARQPGRA